MRVSASVVLPTAVVVASLTGFLLTRVLKAHRERPMTGKEGLVGEVGRVIGELNPEGKIVVHGEYWDARSISGNVAVGNKVRVVKVFDRGLDVAALDGSAEGS